MRAPRAACGLVALLALAGCRTWVVTADEIPDSPIAISYRDPESARRRVDAIREQMEKDVGRDEHGRREAQVGYDANMAVASAGDVGAYFSNLLRTPQSQRESFGGRLALLDPRSGDVHLVDGALRGAIPLTWSRDRERLLFAQPVGREVQIFEYDRGEETVHPVTRGPTSHAQACYGPQGRIVVSAIDRRGEDEPPGSHIEISQTGGRSPYTRLSSGPVDHSPACAPDGSALVFVRRDEQRGLESLVVRAPILDGEERGLGPGRAPSFSPDGQWIVFAAPMRHEWRIWRARRDGTGRSPVGSSIRTEHHPAVSPDGSLVAYVASEEPLRSHVYLRRFDGSGDRILFADGDGDYPVW
jgi:WD40-like Beta Propeller Repeat